MTEDDDRRVIQPAFVIGQDVASLSVAELNDLLRRLEVEAGRIRAAIAAKGDVRSQADALFRL